MEWYRSTVVETIVPSARLSQPSFKLSMMNASEPNQLNQLHPPSIVTFTSVSRARFPFIHTDIITVSYSTNLVSSSLAPNMEPSQKLSHRFTVWKSRSGGKWHLNIYKVARPNPLKDGFVKWRGSNRRAGHCAAKTSKLSRFHFESIVHSKSLVGNHLKIFHKTKKHSNRVSLLTNYWLKLPLLTYRISIGMEERNTTKQADSNAKEIPSGL